ncbi:MAG: hypothetical protein HC845_13830 [Akkermansiaceae bacterium]|nr:hypothetical protein [Akkermansiaceae bacterium]
MSAKIPPPPSEPERYSIDEMMDRLKKPSIKPDEEGELVTRSDGTQAVKVRKRKRRSEQTKKKASEKNLKARIIQVSGVLILFFITALTIGVAITYANSRPFRDKLVQNIQQSSGATAKISQFRMNPKTANAAQVLLKWPEGNALNQLLLTNLSAEIFPASFLGKKMTGEEVLIDQANLNLQIPKTGQATRHTAATTELPSIIFNRYRTQKLDLTLGAPSKPAIQLIQSEGSFSSSDSGKPAQLSLSQGSLIIADWPKLRLARSLVIFRNEELEIVSLNVSHESDSRGSLEFSGKIAPYRTDRMANLAVQLESFQISGIVGPNLGRFFSGRIDSLADSSASQLSFFPSENPQHKLEVAFQISPSSRIEIQGFPFLFLLSRALDDPWFEAPMFESDARGMIERENGFISLRDLNFESKARMKITGAINLAADQSLSGNLRIGISESTIQASSSQRFKSMFSKPENSLCWIDLKIGGTASAPTDNSEELFNSTPFTPQEPSTPASTGKKSTFEELTNPK